MRQKILGDVKDNIYPYKEPKWLRLSTRGLVFNDNNEVAILHIVGKDDFGVRDHYELPGGGIEENEGSLNCFKREMEEELGLVVKDINFLGLISYNYSILELQNYGLYYYAHVDKIVHNNLTELEKTLFKEVIWLKIDDLIRLLSDNSVENVGRLIHKRELIAINEYINVKKY
ncbi:hypothetical protein SDC9_176600 [bioreactor metagenome]|uniref:Nudix hydrolase domain-containing protein n=1 Tax=bioreactor metagenome TaxID=1076179 RepID=A0A645GTJ7_9ZZZZ